MDLNSERCAYAIRRVHGKEIQPNFVQCFHATNVRLAADGATNWRSALFKFVDFLFVHNIIIFFIHPLILLLWLLCII